MENIKITKSLADAARKAHDSADETGKAETTEIAVIVASHPGYFLGNHFIEGDQELVAMTLQEVEIHQAQPLTICRVRTAASPTSPLPKPERVATPANSEAGVGVGKVKRGAQPARAESDVTNQQPEMPVCTRDPQDIKSGQMLAVCAPKDRPEDWIYPTFHHGLRHKQDYSSYHDIGTFNTDFRRGYGQNLEDAKFTYCGESKVLVRLRCSLPQITAWQ
jgi:hypothetical protein